MNAAPHHDAQDEVTISGVQEQLALIQPQALRRLEQPLRSGFADRATARKGLEVAAGFAIADRLGSIRQTQGREIGRNGYMLIVWLGSRWLQMEAPTNTAIPFSQYRMLQDFGWGDAGKPARQALKRTLRPVGRARSTMRSPARRPTRITSASSIVSCGRSPTMVGSNVPV